MGKTKGMINKNSIRKSLKIISNKCYYCGKKITRGEGHYVGMNEYCSKCFYEGKVKA